MMLGSRRWSSRILAAAAVAIAAVTFPTWLNAQAAKPPQKPAAAEPKPLRITSTDPALRLKGFDQHAAMKQTSPFKDVKWQFLGPNNVSGRAIDIAVVAPKGRTYTMYVATASGGLWKTTNEATTWEPVFDQGPATTIGDVTVAPSNANIVWIGTGEANIFRSSQAGICVYKSTDFGKTWTSIAANIPGGPVNVIREDPADQNILYVGTDTGVYVTTDGGKKWDTLGANLPATYVHDLIIHPRDNVIVVATHGRGMWAVDAEPINKKAQKMRRVFEN